MNFEILRKDVQEYIYANENTPVAQLALSKNPFPEIEFSVILNQIAARQKARHKLPVWFESENIVYPSKISVEQTSSWAAAKYKASLVSGESLIDLTGGFGSDIYYFAKRIITVTHCELDNELSVVASHNFKQLNQPNITCIAGDSLHTLAILNTKFDYIYIDPARRNDAKGKVFMLKDCLPDVPALLNTYFQYTNNILLKTAPILDITAGLSELYFVKEIHIVAVNNEVKELLWLLEKDYTSTPGIIAVNVANNDISLFKVILPDNGTTSYSLPKKYLYEPNSAIMKSGVFNAIGVKYNLNKLHLHSHLYTSDDLIDFPGRTFKIETVLEYGKTAMKNHAEGKKMNVTVRNFPLAVEDIRKKWKIKDGGEVYAFFTTDINNKKIVLLCNKI